jgi:CheY-like chemotaxis protein
MEKIEFPIADVLSQMTDMFALEIKKKGLFCEIKAAPELPPLVGDPLRLSQVLLNLISNSIKFTDKGGISLSVLEARRDARRITLKFIVQDTGIGLASEQAKDLFKPFSQADTSTTRKYGGTGLGLTICKKLVDMMNGEIWCDSEPGRGASFTLTAEFGLVADAGTKPDSGRSDRQEEKTELQSLSLVKPVLLVEDNELNQLVAQKFLKKIGVNVDIANNGQEAIEMLLAGDYGLILMDIQMPVMDGISATAKIRKMERFKDIPIIAMTAHAMSGDREKSLEAGMNDHITKPIDSKMVYAALKKWMPGVKN